MIQIKTNKISMNPNMNDPKWEADHFEVILTNGSKQFVTYYSKGIGHRIKSKYTNMPAKVVPPTLREVFECLIMERDALEYTFSEWCDNLGYSDDSIKARNTYDICQKQAVAFRNFLGHAKYNEVISMLDENMELSEQYVSSL